MVWGFYPTVRLNHNPTRAPQDNLFQDIAFTLDGDGVLAIEITIDTVFSAKEVRHDTAALFNKHTNSINQNILKLCHIMMKTSTTSPT